MPLGAVSSLAAPVDAPEQFASGVAEFDRVLGGGLVPRAVILLVGEPGDCESSGARVASPPATAGG